MRYQELFKNVAMKAVVGRLDDVDIDAIVSDSRRVRKGSLFVALRGPNQDGHDFIDEAVRRQAVAVVLQDRSRIPSPAPQVPCVLVEDSLNTLVILAKNFFGDPCRNLKLVGITGTNGKTTVSYLIKSILEAAARPCGLIGTIGYQVRDKNVHLGNTTPGPLELQRIFQEMKEAGDVYAAMEVSSHALHQGRVAGLSFCAGVFTNLTQDHLDYHKDLEDYFQAKGKLFSESLSADGWSLINADDTYGARLAAARRGRVIRYGFTQGLDVRATDYRLTAQGTRFSVSCSAGALDLETKLIGKHNIYNILAAICLGISQDVGLEDIRRGIEAVTQVPGRLERLTSPRGFHVFVDYAHTDDALKNVLESLRAIAHNGRIITVFGCGGDRDRTKRPKMGRVASSLSDFCVVTSDNPRSEDPQAIIRDILEGMERDNYLVEPDRLEAIRHAMGMAKTGDLVLVAGKGHETYQITGDKVVPFDDREAVRKNL
ncbi:MAG: UDP-N-acetylmuramoyl-L-alanyl-D-glutamate--2,6-diaminopimelate ligase [Candidatus Omnitrophica bacterium]|jgi:UDP-N-acetylmuramoyl-L-alanyl-D-glutamate--2,6-diaminopimelate ligase|nr:UDP-N-acetylmuramoyl-L-alanyl-D-glutamate--2,6-diaminopimelate ligase [Candidatus Omnitrophota bacterium]